MVPVPRDGRSAPVSEDMGDALTPRQVEVLAAVGRHLNNEQIAALLQISVRTVESHVSALLKKFSVRDRRALAALAPAALERQPAGPPGPAAVPVAGLPQPWTSFIGRDRERAVTMTALAGHRMVTLTGAPGVGKTRLAMRVAEAATTLHAFEGVFVDLVPVREPGVTQAVAAVLGVTERPGRSLDAAVHEHLARRRVLLVLDNCEHLLGVLPPFVENLLAGCPELTILATSRELLGVPGERAVTVPPLPLAAAGGRPEAEALLADRIRASDPDLRPDQAELGELCARLDGVPLAIELAATRAASLGLDGLQAGLDDLPRLLICPHGYQQRHRSLRAAIDWSYDLLDEDERAMFHLAGVFDGAFGLDAAAASWPGGDRGQAADLIGRLAGQSLLSHWSGPNGSRWQMLQIIRSYTVEKRAGGEGPGAGPAGSPAIGPAGLGRRPGA
jgi:DNA-binding CsgD family transcriptional regulator